MPELPEVETVCRVLSKNITGLTIKTARVINNNLRYNLSYSIEKKILQSKIKSIIRRGKYGIIILNNRNLIIFHLGMTGKFKIYLRVYKKTKHDHLVLEFNNINALMNINLYTPILMCINVYRCILMHIGAYQYIVMHINVC